jgi:hypothetical protein
LNDCGYVTEKLFDALLSGCVPVYLGNESIQKYVPQDVFIDARQFRTRLDLIKMIETMPEDRWRSMRDAGSAFLSSASSDHFSWSQYVQTLIDAVRRVILHPRSRVGD